MEMREVKFIIVAFIGNHFYVYAYGGVHGLRSHHHANSKNHVI